MAQATRTFRLFVSSTFSDLKDERNALHRTVFPALKKLCEENGARFQAIDLRWGVREEAGLDQQTMRICLDEVKRCQDVTPKPNFLVLLGDRYGWRPLPAEIPADEWQQIDRRPEQLKEWYQLDLNACPKATPPGVWLLKPRTESEWGTPRYEDYGVWEREVEWPLREILVAATAGLNLPADARLKYGASATEQEIARGALSVKNAPEHVFCFFRKINGLPEDGTAKGFRDLVPAEHGDAEPERLVPDREADDLLEKLKGPQGKLRQKLPTGNFFQPQANWVALPKTLTAAEWTEIDDRLKDEVRDEAERARLGALLAEWYQSVPADVSLPRNYRLSVRFDALGHRERVEVERSLRRAVFHEGRSPITTGHLEQLCQDVERVLSEVIRDQIAKLEKEEKEKKTTELDKEIAEHEAFRKNRTKFFVGRAGTLQRIANYLAVDDPRPLCLIGEPGSGKSAVLARAVEEARKAYPDAAVIFRFVGWTPGSAVVRELLDKLCRQLARLYDGIAETPSEYRELVQEFPKRMEQAGKKKRLLVFLDALDQLSDADNARNLIWLPMELPPNVRLVVSSSTEPGDTEAVLKRRLPEDCRFPLEDMPVEEADDLLRMWFDDADRTLQGRGDSYKNSHGQWRHVLDRFGGCRRPLYLKLAFEEARRWRSFDDSKETELAPKDTQLPAKMWIPSLVEQLFGRLSSPKNHGGTLVSSSLGYLVAAKNGLTEDEMIAVLSRDETLLKEIKKYHRPPEEKLPVVIWSRLYFDLEPYLTQRSADETTLLAFYHPQLEAVARKNYVEPYKRERHRKLAEYFGDENQKLFLGEGEAKKANIRKLSELPYQQTYGEMWSKLALTLSDLDFLHAKVEHGLLYGAIDDYELAMARLPAAGDPAGDPYQDVRAILREFSSAFNQEFHAFHDCPRTTAQQIYNNLYAHSGFKNQVGAVLTRFAERGAYPGGGPWLRRLNAAPDTSTSRALRRTLAGHEGPVTALAVSPSGTRIASGGVDGTLRIWQSRNGALLASFFAHRGGVTALDWRLDDPNETWVVSAGRDQVIREWDWQSEQEIRSWHAHISRIRGLVSAAHHGQIVSCSDDRTLRVWSLPTKREVRRLYGHLDRVLCLATDRGGNVVISGSDDTTLKIWRTQDAREPITLRGHVDSVRCVAVDAGGNWAVSGSDDLALKVWDLAALREARTLARAHEHRITCVGIVSRQGMRPLTSTDAEESTQRGESQRFVSASDDGTIRLWERATGELLGTLRGHLGGVTALSTHPDGRRFASGGEDGTIRIWDTALPVRGSQGSNEHWARVTAVAGPSAGGRVVSGSDDQTAGVWDPDGPGGGSFRLRGHLGPVTCLALQGEDRIVTGSSDRTLRVWDARSGKCLATLGSPVSGNEMAERLLVGQGHSTFGSSGGHQNAVTCVTALSDTLVISGGRDRTVRLWDTRQRTELRVFRRATGMVNCIQFCQPLGLLIAGGTARTVDVWEVNGNGEPYAHLGGLRSGITCLGMAADDRLVAGSRDGTINQWNLRTLGAHQPLGGKHEGGVTCLACVPRLGIVASGGRDMVVRLHDLQERAAPRTLLGHRAPVRAMAVDEQSNRLSSCGDDHRVIVWELDTGHHLASVAVGSPISAFAAITSDVLCVGTDWGGVALFRLSGETALRT